LNSVGHVTLIAPMRLVREDRNQMLGAIRHLDQDAVARAHAQPQRAVRGPCDNVAEVAAAQLAVAVFQEGFVGHPRAIECNGSDKRTVANTVEAGHRRRCHVRSPSEVIRAAMGSTA
jgi:hypothetical protein